MNDDRRKVWIRIKKGTWKNIETNEMLFCDKAVFTRSSVLFIRGGAIIRTLSSEIVDGSAMYAIAPDRGC